MRKPRLPALLGIAFVAVLVTLLTVEAGLRYYIDNLTPEARESRRGPLLQDLPDSDRVYGLKPLVGPPVSSNSHGFRGPEVSPTKGPGQFRIVMLGDSITYGNSVEWDQTFSYELQTLLKGTDTGTRVEVLNLGVSGYNTQQQLATLRELGMQFSPDLIVLNVCLNDSDPVRHLYGLALKNETRPLAWSDINFRTIVDSSYMLTLLKHRLSALLQSLGGDPQTLNSPTIFLDNRVRETAWRDMKASMREIHEVAKNAGVPLVAVIYPYASQVELPAAQRIPQQDLLAFFASLGVPALEVTPAYQHARQDMFVDGYIHLSPYGHKVVAETLLAFLTERNLLPRPVPTTTADADGK